MLPPQPCPSQQTSRAAGPSMSWTSSASRSLGWVSATAPTPLHRTSAPSSGATWMALSPFATQRMAACPGLMGHPVGLGTSAGMATVCLRRKWRSPRSETATLGRGEAGRRASFKEETTLENYELRYSGPGCHYDF